MTAISPSTGSPFKSISAIGWIFSFGILFLGASLVHASAGVHEHNMALASLRLALRQHDDDFGGTGVVEQVVRQQNHAVDGVLLDEPPADIALSIRVLGT